MTQSNTTTVEAPAPPQDGTYLPVPLALDFRAMEMTGEQFVQFCSDNGELRIELTAKRELIIMPPANPDTGHKNHTINGELYAWSKQDGTGLGFDSSTGFTFPNGAMRSPDASWVARERWEALPQGERTKFSRLVPDFVVEFRSPSDTLPMLLAKMSEYMENGVRLGWLIDPFQRRVYVYRPGHPVETLEAPESVSGDPELPGFALNLQDIW